MKTKLRFFVFVFVHILNTFRANLRDAKQVLANNYSACSKISLNKELFRVFLAKISKHIKGASLFTYQR